MSQMENLKMICEKASDGKFPDGFTLMAACHLIDVYNDLARGNSHVFIEVEIARFLEDLDIPVRKIDIGWEAISPVIC